LDRTERPKRPLQTAPARVEPTLARNTDLHGRTTQIVFGVGCRLADYTRCKHLLCTAVKRRGRVSCCSIREGPAGVRAGLSACRRKKERERERESERACARACICVCPRACECVFVCRYESSFGLPSPPSHAPPRQPPLLLACDGGKSVSRGYRGPSVLHKLVDKPRGYVSH